MPLVTVKDKFQVTIPARLRQALSLQVGDVLEAAVEDDRIVLRPKAVVDRAALADRLEAMLTETAPEAERSEEQVLDEVDAEIAAARAERRRRGR